MGFDVLVILEFNRVYKSVNLIWKVMGLILNEDELEKTVFWKIFSELKKVVLILKFL